MTIGALLRRYRLTVGLTQEELAERAGVSSRTISDVERGLRKKIYRDTATLLADALELRGVEREDFERAARGPTRSGVSRPELVRPPTSLVGRERELEIVRGLLARDDIRLMTLTGAGGIGKTRVLLEVAATADDAGEVWFLDMGDVTDPRDVVPAIARAVGLPGTKTHTAEGLGKWLDGTTGLMVLDTFEHVLAAGPGIAKLISLCDGVRFLVGSRQPLRIQGEHTVGIPPLSLPAGSAVQSVMTAAASALFVERVRAARHDLSLAETDMPVIADICRSLSGLPLAIELAAARVAHMSLGELQAQLSERLNVLTGGPPDLPRRQQTIRDAIGWSYDLLTSDERAMFNELCVFAGGWTLDAATAVLDRAVLPGLSALLDKSLVVHDLATARYGLLDVIREFGREQGLPPAAADRHLKYFLRLAEEAEDSFGSSGQSRWAHRVDQERANIRAASDYAVATRDADAALRLTGAMWRYWMLDGSLAQGRDALAAALAADPEGVSPHRPKALWGAAWLAYHQGDLAATASCGDEMLSLASSTDPIALRNAWTIKGLVALADQRLDDAVDLFERCVRVLRDHEPDWLFATSLLNLAMALTHSLDPRVDEVLAEARGIYRNLGDRNFAARTDIYSGYASFLSGEVGRARSSFRTAIISFSELRDDWGTSEALGGLAITEAVERHSDAAALLGGASEAIRELDHRMPLPADRLLIDRVLERAKALTNDATWHRAWQLGRSMTVEAAVEFALDASSPRP
ncbi:MAG: helix-turn-helix domain-containing protein [Actinomycetota bacterium]|nr:helix-turn-helix domain-containing protein [Actinomycetota bacterium]